jgi:hypothetical protein
MENQNGKVKCEFCGKEVSAKGLKTHIRMKHTEAPKADEAAAEITSPAPVEKGVAVEATETTPFIPVAAKRPDADVAAVEVPKAPVPDVQLSHKQNLYRRNRK